MEVYDWPANRFVAGFIGTPAMNFIEGELDWTATDRQFRRGALVAFRWPSAVGVRLRQADQRPAALGVRPEDVRIAVGPTAATAGSRARRG